MAAKRVRPVITATSGQERPRLGMVVRFAPAASAAGVKQLEASGMKVASSSDFRSAKAVPNDFGGADVQYFERFGIAIVRGATERADAMLARAIEEKVVGAARPERSYRALGQPGASLGVAGGEPPGPVSHDYLQGYRAGVNELIDNLLHAGGSDGPALAAARAADPRHTWGLVATGVAASRLTGAGIKVAVLDTGFDDAHPDFVGRTIRKKTFVTNSSDGDKVGHGTHCIGTACGPLAPVRGPRYGIAHKADIFAGKVLGDDGRGTDRSIIAGMEWALDQGCHVISLSLGAETFIGDQPNDDYEDIGRICLDAGALVVAAAGNESQRPGVISPVGSPANASTILSVAAVDARLAIAAFSCGGLNAGQEVDIAGPGVDVLSSVPEGGTRSLNGTSMATPHVAGIAALIAQSNPRYRGWALWARVVQLAKRLNLPARDGGKGLVQAPRR